MAPMNRGRRPARHQITDSPAVILFDRKPKQPRNQLLASAKHDPLSSAVEQVELKAVDQCSANQKHNNADSQVVEVLAGFNRRDNLTHQKRLAQREQ
jgi:hypothetical protein